MVAVCTKKEAEGQMAQVTTRVRAENVNSEPTGTLANRVLFEVPPRQLTFSSKPTYRLQIYNGLIKSALYSTTCSADKDAGSNLINEAYVKPHWKVTLFVLKPQTSNSSENVEQGTWIHYIDWRNGLSTYTQWLDVVKSLRTVAQGF